MRHLDLHLPSGVLNILKFTCERRNAFSDIMSHAWHGLLLKRWVLAITAGVHLDVLSLSGVARAICFFFRSRSPRFFPRRFTIPTTFVSRFHMGEFTTKLFILEMISLIFGVAGSKLCTQVTGNWGTLGFCWNSNIRFLVWTSAMILETIFLG